MHCCITRGRRSEPTLHPFRKWVIGFAFLGLFALLLAFGLFSGFPLWLKALGWASIVVLCWVGGYVYMIYRRTAKDRRHSRRPSHLYPQP